MLGEVMDKDSVILKYDQIEVNSISEDIETVSKKNSAQADMLDEMDGKIAEIYAVLGKKPKQVIREFKESSNEIDDINVEANSYDELFEIAKSSLIDRGLDVELLDYHDLVSEKELDEIIEDLNRPLFEREQWKKSDFIAVFIAASIGSLVDIILGTRDNKLTGADPRKHFESKFSAWLNRFHKHEGGGPIDYQGEGFGGGFHRGLSKGHDILRFIEAIIMFKNGQFEGIRYVNGEAIKVVSKVNQYGNPYEQLSWIDAICRYAKHMFADLFSTCSLPFPGYSFLVESDNRQLRKFAADMYQNGFNCKNVLIQGLSTAIIEIILRIYFSVQSVRKMNNDTEIAEDYSNWEKIKEFANPQNKEKLNEMLLVAHSIVTAMNIGKVVIKKAPWEINITEIISVIKYGVKVMKANQARNSEYGKLIRNSEELHARWEELEQQLTKLDEESINEMPDETLLIA